MTGAVAASPDLTSLPAEVLALIAQLQQQAAADAQELTRRGRELTLAQAKIDKLNFEIARLRRWQFEAKTEAMTAAQRLLFAEALADPGGHPNSPTDGHPKFPHPGAVAMTS